MTNSNYYREVSSQDRFGQRIAARLSHASAELPHDVSERLRAARMQALGKRKVAAVWSVKAAVVSSGAGTLSMGEDNFNLWNWIGSAIPVIALLVGLVTINVIQNDNRAVELAEVDVALLTDALPPAAYADPGFAQFLKLAQEQAP